LTRNYRIFSLVLAYNGISPSGCSTVGTALIAVELYVFPCMEKSLWPLYFHFDTELFHANARQFLTFFGAYKVSSPWKKEKTTPMRHSQCCGILLLGNNPGQVRYARGGQKFRKRKQPNKSLELGNQICLLFLWT
jgi:hypothetical protein